MCKFGFGVLFHLYESFNYELNILLFLGWQFVNIHIKLVYESSYWQCSVAVQVTQDVVRVAHIAGLRVRVCVSSVGPGNQNMWKVVGVLSRKESVVDHISHPCSSSHRLLFHGRHTTLTERNCLLTQAITLPRCHCRRRSTVAIRQCYTWSRW